MGSHLLRDLEFPPFLRYAVMPVARLCRPRNSRATGITSYLENGETIEKPQMIANHESLRTTKLYDRTQDQLTLDEIERIRI